MQSIFFSISFNEIFTLKSHAILYGNSSAQCFGDRPPLHLHKPNVSGEPTGLKEEYQKFWRCPGAVAGSSAPAAHLQNFSLSRP